MLTIIGSTTTYIFSTLLTANNNLRQLIWIAAVAALINYLLNRLLIPAEKAWGSAAAAAITQIGIGAAHLILSAIVFRFRLNTALMGKLILYAIASSVLFFSLKQLPLNWILTFMTGTAICLLLAFALRLLDVKKVAALVMRSREETVS
jgi:O-antigen/teichoic acid export membrane protein